MNDDHHDEPIALTQQDGDHGVVTKLAKEPAAEGAHTPDAAKEEDLVRVSKTSSIRN